MRNAPIPDIASLMGERERMRNAPIPDVAIIELGGTGDWQLNNLKRNLVFQVFFQHCLPA
jgi:hypothetical protein